MSVAHLVRIGLMGEVGACVSADSRVYPRDCRVICRTERGLEHGTVVCPVDSNGSPTDATAQILRRVSPEDQLILDRLDKHRDRAFAACQQLIREHQLPMTLVDVEHLFDGESVFFYFLGPVDARVEALTDRLAQTYERKVRFRAFAKTLAEGCGPDCGTGSGGCASGGCSSCKLSGACGSR